MEECCWLPLDCPHHRLTPIINRYPIAAGWTRQCRISALSKEPTQGFKCPQRRLNQQPLGYWPNTYDHWAVCSSVKVAGLFFNKYGTIKSGKSSRYRFTELWKAFLIHDILMVCCPFSNSNLHYCQTHYLSAFRYKGKGGYHYILYSKCTCIKIHGAFITQFCLYSSEQVKWDY